MTAGRTFASVPERRARQRGATMVEFAVVLFIPAFLMLIFATAEMALMYQAKTVVDIAALAAARAGAIDHAREGVTSSMHIAGASALAPLYMRDTASNGEVVRAAGSALADSVLFLNIDVLSPTRSSYDDHGITVANRRLIPNDNLMYRGTAIKSASMQNIQDANLLKIRLTYCYKPEMPLNAEFLAMALSPFSFLSGARCKVAGRIPISSEAIVRMQSDAWRSPP